MESKRLSRRDFLKLMSLAPALMAQLPVHSNENIQNERNHDSTLPNILILVFDALSAMHMSIYGYARSTTPHIERFAQASTVYHRHYAAGNFTTPGTASLLTGTYPWSHRALHMHGSVTEAYRKRNLFAVLNKDYHTFSYTHNPLVAILLHQFFGYIDQLKDIPDLCIAAHTIAEHLSDRDLQVTYDSELALFRSGGAPSSSLFLSIVDKLQRVIQMLTLEAEYRTRFPRGVPNYFDEVSPSFIFFTLETAVDWLTDYTLRSPQPFLGYVHLLPPHGPYTTRHDFVDRFQDNWQPPIKPVRYFTDGHPEEFLQQERRHYDEYIAYADAEFGRLAEALSQSGLLENTLLILTSDHGELFERGIYTHISPTLYEPILHIPLIIHKPGQHSREDIYTPTSCVDLLPTLLQLSGQPIPDWCEGAVLPTFSGYREQTQREIYAVEAKENVKQAPLRKVSLALLQWPYKLVNYLGYEKVSDAYELYNIESDPLELQDLYSRETTLVAKMMRALTEKLAEVDAPYHRS